MRLTAADLVFIQIGDGLGALTVSEDQAFRALLTKLQNREPTPSPTRQRQTNSWPNPSTLARKAHRRPCPQTQSQGWPVGELGQLWTTYRRPEPANAQLGARRPRRPWTGVPHPLRHP
jgi:hypothetical protein